MMSDDVEQPNEEGDEGDDAALDEFVSEWEALKEKVGRIPDDIGDQLANISAKLGAGTSGGGQSSGTSRRAPAQPGGTTRQRAAQGGQEQEHAATPPAEKRPQSQHWYYRERKRKE